MNNFVGRRVIKNASGRSFSGKVTGYNNADGNHMFAVAYENNDNVYSDGSNMSETGNNSEDEEQISYDDLVKILCTEPIKKRKKLASETNKK